MILYSISINNKLYVSQYKNTENASYYAELEEIHNELVGETVEVGLMFASKAFVQLLANPIVGPLTHKLDYSYIIFFLIKINLILYNFCVVSNFL